MIFLYLLLAFSTSVFANPVLVTRSPITLPLSRIVNFTSAHNLVQHDRARARMLKAKGESQGTARRAIFNTHEPITNQAVAYVASVGVGSPATTCWLKFRLTPVFLIYIIVCSSNTWVGAGSMGYKQTSTSHNTGDSVSVSYGSGSFSGEEYTDQVSVGRGLEITNQSIGGFDGILGLGPTDLTQGTLSSGSIIPPLIFAHEIGVSFEPTATSPNENGEITWGGTNLLKYFLPITYIPITNTAPAKYYWGIDQSIRYGPSTTFYPRQLGLYYAYWTSTDAYNKYQNATGSTVDPNVGLLALPSSKYSSLKSLYFTTGGKTFELIPNAQIWPRSLNSEIGGASGMIYLVIHDLESPSGQGLDFINGLTFLERFYSVYDSENGRVGLANTLWTMEEVN
ncbi:aspartic peptidase A1 [Gymnopilus junonius]|uniref:Aspartic peptidase A1 n=1 Tax=Gymnopilus junonius TaxID=109634 RepID=A0A9P5ND61_GYMJU|nr:aspartic peptidase A1 [Gymnopilus junonius]